MEPAFADFAKKAYFDIMPNALENHIAFGIHPAIGNPFNRLRFTVMPPWDERVKEQGDKFPGEMGVLCVYVPFSDLVNFGAGIGTTGGIYVPMNVPFSMVKNVWRYQRKGGEAWSPKLIMAKRMEEEIVLGMRNAKRAANIEVLLSAATDTWSSPDIAPALRDEMLKLAAETLNDLAPGQRKSGGDGASPHRQRLRSLVLQHYKPKSDRWCGLRCRLCPGCLKETPASFCECLLCEGTFVSYGTSRSVLSPQEKEIIDVDKAAEGVDIDQLVKESQREAEKEAEKEDEEPSTAEFIISDAGQQAQAPLISEKLKKMKERELHKDEENKLKEEMKEELEEQLKQVDQAVEQRPGLDGCRRKCPSARTPTEAAVANILLIWVSFKYFDRYESFAAKSYADRVGLIDEGIVGWSPNYPRGLTVDAIGNPQMISEEKFFQRRKEPRRPHPPGMAKIQV